MNYVKNQVNNRLHYTVIGRKAETVIRYILMYWLYVIKANKCLFIVMHFDFALYLVSLSF